MSTFAVLAREDTEAAQARHRAITASRVRAQNTFGRFLANAKSPAERLERLDGIEEDLRVMAGLIATEHAHTDSDEIYKSARAFLACDSDCKGCSECEDKDDGDKDDKDDDKDSKSKDWKKPWEKDTSTHSLHYFGQMNPAVDGMWHFAAGEPEDGDSYQQERESLPTSDGTGLGDTGAVPTDKGKAGDVAANSLDKIDVDSKQHPLETQAVSDRADYNAKDFDPDSPVRDRVNPSTPMQPEYTKGPETGTWSGTAGQAAPVTNTSLNSFSHVAKYEIVDLTE